ncbi:hypothetical protein BSBH6_03526 [Bacillus subtilis]|nr:hypothetical protein BSBH6_03526 [Bacillus subtilis]RPK22265.1 hypothetical protein BH5_03530 [Bacillus subtilis]
MSMIPAQNPKTLHSEYPEKIRPDHILNKRSPAKWAGL